jgi:hypothetical protein
MAKGSKIWALLGGNIPEHSTGPEPGRTSRDVLTLLNTGSNDAAVSVTVYYTDRESCGPYEVTVGAGRLRDIRFNDLINPEAIQLATDYAAIIESDKKILVGFSRVDTSSGSMQRTNLTAYPVE